MIGFRPVFKCLNILILSGLLDSCGLNNIMWLHSCVAVIRI